jgi:transposase-like protein
MKTYTIKDFDKQFPTDDACLEFLFNARFPNGAFCPKCQKITPHYRIANRKVFSCQNCGSHISPTANTIFHKSDTPLRSWFHAMFLMSSTKTGISAKQLQRELGVTYKTAWRMFKEIRKLMTYNVNPLSGQVEVDETYVGGKRQGTRGRGASGKTIVMGMVERDGNAITKVIPDVKAHTLLPMIEQNVEKSNKTVVYTDELPSYHYVERLGYAHEIVQHSAKQYVSGIVHVNTMESLLLFV